jgi:hypothetical protein
MRRSLSEAVVRAPLSTVAIRRRLPVHLAA